jgi:sterol 14-demethylase
MINAECADFFTNELKLDSSNPGPKTVEIFKTMSSLIILTAARTLQGKEVRQSMDSRFAQRMHHLDGGFTPLNFLFPNLPLPSYKRRDKAQQEMSDFYVNIMKKRDEGESEVSQVEAPCTMTCTVTYDQHGGDMIAALQGSIYKDGKELTNRDIAHMMIAILMAGQHTSSATSSWTLLHIAHRPDVA